MEKIDYVASLKRDFGINYPLTAEELYYALVAKSVDTPKKNYADEAERILLKRKDEFMESIALSNGVSAEIACVTLKCAKGLVSRIIEPLVVDGLIEKVLESGNRGRPKPFWFVSPKGRVYARALGGEYSKWPINQSEIDLKK